jgi:excisionase family DNA binding protein
MTVLEACAALHCSRAHVFRLLAAGTLRRIRIGKRTLVGAESVAALLAPPVERHRKPRTTRSGFVPFTRDEV